MTFDVSLFKIIYGLSGKWWPLDWLGVFLANYLPYLMVLFTIFILFKEKVWRKKIYFFCLSALSVILARGIITEIIRFFHFRMRPFLALHVQPLIEKSDTAGSFPSGHAAAFFALGLAIFYFLRDSNGEINPKWGWWLLGAAAAISIARVFVGVHWPTDILAGALIGLGSAFLIKKILPPIKNEENGL